MACKWKQGNASVFDARKASLGAHAVASSVGNTTATAHMVDYSLGAVQYDLEL